MYYFADSPQPMYVNMHELATMAASKAQEMSFPPPPPELINIPPETQEKVRYTSAHTYFH